MYELIGADVGVVEGILVVTGVCIAGYGIFSAIRHRRSATGRNGGQIGDGSLVPHIHVDAPMPPVKRARRPTLAELRARLALAEAPPVCPDCGGIMHKEADVDPKGIWFVSWRCDCLWTPTEEG